MVSSGGSATFLHCPCPYLPGLLGSVPSPRCCQGHGAGGAGAGGEKLLEVEVEDVREVGGDVGDGAATVEEPPVPGTVTPS